MGLGAYGRRISALACITLLTLGFLGAVFLVTPAFALNAGETAKDAVQLGGFTLPLPQGEWTAFYATEDSDDKFRNSKLGLVLVSGNSVKQMAYFRVSQSKTGSGFRPYEQCALPHYFYSETSSNQIGGAQDCWHVQVETLAPDEATDRQKALLEFAKSRGLFLPLAIIGPRFHRASSDVLLQASYGWTPDLIIKAPKDTKVWRFQDWTAEAVAKDPRKKVVMNKFKRWGEDWRPRIDTVFSDAKK